MSVLKIEFDTNDTDTLNVMTSALLTLRHIKNGETKQDEAPTPAPVQEAEAPVEAPAPAPVQEATPPAPVQEATPPAPAPAPAPAQEAETPVEANPVQAGAELDAAGMPWDSRIHSRTKSQDARGVWKLSRMPKRFETKQEWEAYIEECRAENRGMGESIVEPPKVVSGHIVKTEDTPPAPAPVQEVPPAPSGVVEGAPSVFNDEPTTPPAPAPVQAAPQAEATPPAPAPVQAAPQAEGGMKFGDIMKFVTVNKIDMNDVTAIISKFGIAKLPLLAQRPDLFETVHAELSALVS